MFKKYTKNLVKGASWDISGDQCGYYPQGKMIAV